MLRAHLNCCGPIPRLVFVSPAPACLLVSLPLLWEEIPHSSPTLQDSPSLLSLRKPPKIVGIDLTDFLWPRPQIPAHLETHRGTHRPWHVQRYTPQMHPGTHRYKPAPLVPHPSRHQHSGMLRGGFRQATSADRRTEFESPHLFSLKSTPLSGPHFIIYKMRMNWVIFKILFSLASLAL